MSVRVVVLVQENKTTDFYFPSMASWADVQPYGTPLVAAPAYDQPHDRNAWVHYAMGDYPAVELSIADEQVIPYYSWLAKTFTFCDHHFGAGTNSTPGTFSRFPVRPPPSATRPPPGSPGLGRPDRVHFGRPGRPQLGVYHQDGYPVNLVKELSTAEALAGNVHGPGGFATAAHAGTLPDLCYVWKSGRIPTSIPLESECNRLRHERARPGLVGGRRGRRRRRVAGHGLRSPPGTTGAATPITSRHRISKLCPTHSILAGFRPSGASHPSDNVRGVPSRRASRLSGTRMRPSPSR